MATCTSKVFKIKVSIIYICLFDGRFGSRTIPTEERKQILNNCFRLGVGSECSGEGGKDGERCNICVDDICAPCGLYPFKRKNDQGCGKDRHDEEDAVDVVKDSGGGIR